MPRIELSFESGEDSLSVRRFSVREAVSQPFEVSVWARSPEPALDLDRLVGHEAGLRVEGGDSAAQPGGGRRWTGIVNLAELVQTEPTGLSTYHVRIVPRLWLLGQRRNLRIFQHRSAPDIVKYILDEWGIEPAWELARSAYPKLEYKVQYDESDLAFVCRILEGAGIAFVFGDDPDKGSTLAISDALHDREARPPIRYVDHPSRAPDVEFVTHVRLAHEVRPDAYTLRDHDFRNPAYPLVAPATTGGSTDNRREQYHYRPGAFLIDLDRGGGSTPHADDQSVARHDEGAGARRAELGLSSDRLGDRLVSFGANAADLRPGVVFSVAGHPHMELGEGERLLVTETLGEGSIEGSWSVSARAVFAARPFVPAQKTPRPTLHGVQSATVVGPPGQDIHTDEFGRVRVQFPWDREGGNDDRSSCWLRVGQGWAGTGFGVITVPRVGQEVLVGFLEGDPEQPIVVGRVYNGKNPSPYKLPEKKTVSTWRSESTPGGGGYNEIVFEDLKGSELVGVRAERDLRALVKRDRVSTVGRHRRRLVKGHELEVTRGDHTVFVAKDRKELVLADVTERVLGDMLERTGGDEHLIVAKGRKELVVGDRHDHVKGDRRAKIDGKLSLTVGGERHEKVGGCYALGTSGELHVKAGGSMVIEAQDLTLKGPGGFVRIDAGGVTIKGKLVKINSSGGSAGSGSGASPDAPDRPEEAEVDEPEIDDVSRTGHGP
jgi:type VI secretion system secreted protein VgrG